ncbi:hypothetical protein D8B30_08800 [Verminephrobacter eiseniae]|nr:hypothetical protein [Verminephrobacter eiseniae]MCW8189887.1 hypothetical protein [Verminephrobacter eiseniae]
MLWPPWVLCPPETFGNQRDHQTVEANAFRFGACTALRMNAFANTGNKPGAGWYGRRGRLGRRAWATGAVAAQAQAGAAIVPRKCAFIREISNVVRLIRC